VLVDAVYETYSSGSLPEVVEAMSALRRVLGVALFIAAPIAREWSSHVLRFISAAWIVVPFYALGGSKLALHALVGALVNMVFSACIYSAYEEALYDLQGLRDLFLASPLTSLEFRAGLALGILLTTIPSIAACIAAMLSLARCSLLSAVLVVLMIPVLWALSVLVGYLIPVRRNVLATGNIIRVLSIVLVAVPPIYYPLSAWPRPLQPIAFAVPTFNVAEVIKHLIGIERGTHTLEAAVIALIVELAALTIAVLLRERRG